MVATCLVSEFFSTPFPGLLLLQGLALPRFSVLTRVLVPLFGIPSNVLQALGVFLMPVNASPLVAQGLCLPRNPGDLASG